MRNQSIVNRLCLYDCGLRLAATSGYVACSALCEALPHAEMSYVKAQTPTAFHYQDQPDHGKRCQDCTEFLPAAWADAEGTWRIVAGPIRPNGWCMALTSK
jgi:hypothetical protein